MTIRTLWIWDKPDINSLLSFLAHCEENTTKCVSFGKCYTAKNLVLANSSDDREERHQKVKELQHQTCYLSNEPGFCCKSEEISEEDLNEKYGKSFIIQIMHSDHAFVATNLSITAEPYIIQKIWFQQFVQNYFCCNMGR